LPRHRSIEIIGVVLWYAGDDNSDTLEGANELLVVSASPGFAAALEHLEVLVCEGRVVARLTETVLDLRASHSGLAQVLDELRLCDLLHSELLLHLLTLETRNLRSLLCSKRLRDGRDEDKQNQTHQQRRDIPAHLPTPCSQRRSRSPWSRFRPRIPAQTAGSRW
jgi:hypothetical protein